MRRSVIALALAALAFAAAVGRAEEPSTGDLIAQLSGEDLGGRRKAAYALWQLGAAASPAALPLASAVGDDDGYVRSVAAKALVKMGDAAGAGVPSIARLLTSQKQEIRREAATLLFRMGALSAGAIEPLTTALASTDYVVRSNAAAALGNAGPAAKGALAPLTQALDDDKEEVCRWAAKAVAKIDPAAAFASKRAEVRLEALKTYGDRPEARGWTKPAVVAGVLSAIDDPNEEIRGWAVHALDVFATFAGDDRPVAWIAVFRGVLENERAPAVCATAAYGLGRYKGHGPEVVPVLAKAAESREPDVQRAALLALGWLGTEARSTVPIVLRALASEHHQTRSFAATSLAGLGDRSKPVIAGLVEATRSRDRSVSRSSVRALGALGTGSEPAARALIAFLTDTSRSGPSRGAAAVSLARIDARALGIAPLTTVFEKEADAPSGIAFALVALEAPIAQKALDRLADRLVHDDAPYQELSLLQELGPKAAGAVPALAPLLGAEDVSVVFGAIAALEAVGPAAKSALAALESAAKRTEPEVGDAARRAIEVIRNESAETE